MAYRLIKRTKPPITQEKLKKLVHYDPETGVFTWIARTSWRIHIGDRAGSFTNHGYRNIKILGHTFGEHRWAWLYMTGEFPDRIDHDDEDGTNNRFKNLRKCTKSQNACNRGAQSNNTSGFKGVYWHKKARKWLAQIVVNGKHHYLGLFSTPEGAYEAYCCAADKLHAEFSNHGSGKQINNPPEGIYRDL